MSYTSYDSFIAPNSDRGSIEVSTDPNATLYPEASYVSVFGPVLAPRVYGKDLTSFELASSGSIAVTLSDVMSFFLERGLVGSNVSLRTVADDNFDINVGGGSMRLGFDAVGKTVSMASASNIMLGASNWLSNLSSNIDIHATRFLNLHSSNMAVSAYDIDVNAGHAFVVDATSNIVLRTPDTIVFSASNFIYDFSNISFSGKNIASAGDSVVLEAVGALVTITPSNVSFYSSNVMYMQSSNIDMNSAGALSLSAWNDQGGLNISKSNDVTSFTGTADTFTFNTGESNIITATSEGVVINGNLDVNGTLKYANSTTPSNLRVFDKTLLLAYNPKNPTTDGTLNDKAGLVVEGNGAEKSFTWNHNNGTQHLGTSAVDDESYWELKGGALRVSQGDHSFGFRVNDLGEFELVKKMDTGFKRIAKFGKAFML